MPSPHWMLALAFCAASVTALAATPDWPAPEWRADAALRQAKSTTASTIADALLDTLREHPDELAAALDALVARNDLSWPLREAAVMRLLQALDGTPRHRIPEDAVLLLAGWQPRTLVPHEEDASLGAPLFDIAARTHGLQNRWRREAVATRAKARARDDAEAFVTAWSASADAVERAGLLDALDAGGAALQRGVLEAALAAGPSLRQPAAHAALALRDVDAMHALILHGAGNESRQLLDAIGQRLDARSLTALLIRLRTEAPPGTQALAIGLWSARLAGDADTEAVLLDLLGDAELGSSAALALQRAPSAAALKQLRMLALSPDVSPRAARARLALQIERSMEMPR
jgi:hypothetical protein